MLSNAYFLAKFRFDTAENEPAKNLQNFRKMHFSKMHAEVHAACPHRPTHEDAHGRGMDSAGGSERASVLKEAAK